MSIQAITRRSLLAFTLLFLFWLAWRLLSGGFSQIPRSRTPGQKVETVTQITCGCLSLLVILTCFWQRHWAPQVHMPWSISLAATAGISALVWGPPMPLVSLVFAVIALVVARVVKWALHSASGVN